MRPRGVGPWRLYQTGCEPSEPLRLHAGLYGLLGVARIGAKLFECRTLARCRGRE